MRLSLVSSALRPKKNEVNEDIDFKTLFASCLIVPFRSSVVDFGTLVLIDRTTRIDLSEDKLFFAVVEIGERFFALLFDIEELQRALVAVTREYPKASIGFSHVHHICSEEKYSVGLLFENYYCRFVFNEETISRAIFRAENNMLSCPAFRDPYFKWWNPFTWF